MRAVMRCRCRRMCVLGARRSRLRAAPGDDVAWPLGGSRPVVGGRFLDFVLVAWLDVGSVRDDRVQALREVAEFSAIAFGVTGLLHGSLAASRRPSSLDENVPALLYTAGLAGPTLAAIVVEQRHRGRTGVGALLGSAQSGTLSWGRVTAAVGAQPLMMIAAAGLSGRRVRVTRVDPLLAIGQLWVVAGEEFGWRGFAWPRLAQRFGPVRATLALATLWGLWHVPMFFVAKSPQAEDSPLRFGSAILAWSFLHTLLQSDDPSVAIAMMFHAASNLSLQALDTDTERPSTALVVVYAGVAAACASIIALRRRRSQTCPR